MKIIKSVLILLSISTTTWSSPVKDMQGAFDSLLNLTPYYVNETKFTDPKNNEKIYNYISQLNKAFSNLKHDEVLKSANFKPTLSVIKSHLAETEDSYRMGQKHFARNRIKSTAGLCIQCHSQIKTKASNTMISKFKLISKKIESDFDKAEISILLRDYDKAINLYQSYINATLDKEQEFKRLSNIEYLPYRNIRTSFKRILSIHLKVNKDIKKAQRFIYKFQRKTGLSKFLKEELKSWENELALISNKKTISKLENMKKIDFFLEKNMDYDKELSLLLASGKILELMNEGLEKEENALALYWLSKAERKLNFSYFFSMADNYLETCLESFSSTKTAKKCLNEYKNQMKLGYTGSGGYQMPNQVIKKIRYYENKVNMKKRK